MRRGGSLLQSLAVQILVHSGNEKQCPAIATQMGLQAHYSHQALFLALQIKYEVYIFLHTWIFMTVCNEGDTSYLYAWPLQEFFLKTYLQIPLLLQTSALARGSRRQLYFTFISILYKYTYTLILKMFSQSKSGGGEDGGTCLNIAAANHVL